MNGKVLRLIKDATLPTGLAFKSGQEFEIVMNVVYMGGFPLPQDFQSTILSWINNNPTLFKDDTRRW